MEAVRKKRNALSFLHLCGILFSLINYFTNHYSSFLSRLFRCEKRGVYTHRRRVNEGSEDRAPSESRENVQGLMDFRCLEPVFDFTLSNSWVYKEHNDEINGCNVIKYISERIKRNWSEKKYGYKERSNGKRACI